MVPEDRVFRGEWWHAGDEAEPPSYPGTLRIEPSGRATLELNPGFPRLMPVDGNGVLGQRLAPDPERIFGNCDNESFTLLGVLSLTGWSPTDTSAHQILSADRVLKGVWMPANDEARFISAVVGIDYLLPWTGMSSLKELTHEPDGTSSARSGPSQTLTAQWRHLSVQVTVTAWPFHFDYIDGNTHTATSTERATFKIDCDTPMTLSQFDREVSKVQDLLTLSMYEPCGVQFLHLGWNAPGEEEVQRVEVFSRPVYRRESAPPKPAAGRQLLLLEQVAFDALIPAWFDLYEKAELAIQMLAGLHYVDRGYVGTRLLTVGSALESLHRSLYNKKVWSGGQLNEMKTQAREGLDPKYTPYLTFSDQPTYVERLVDLAGRVHPKAAADLLGDIAEWAELVKTVRNGLAHADLKGRALPVILRIRLLAVSQALGCLVIANALGLHGKDQQQFVLWNGEVAYAAREFTKLLAERVSVVESTPDTGPPAESV
jgi:hypothetical protein